MRYVYDRDTGRVIEAHLRPPRQVARSGLSMPMVLSDSMEPTMHPATGKLMDSKAAFRRVTRAAGCVEVGTEKLDTGPRKIEPDRTIAADVARALAEHGI